MFCPIGKQYNTVQCSVVDLPRLLLPYFCMLQVIKDWKVLADLVTCRRKIDTWGWCLMVMIHSLCWLLIGVLNYLIPGNFWGKKLSWIGEKYDFRRENFWGLLTFTAPKDAMPPNFVEKTFANNHKTVIFMKVFSLKSFPLYGIDALLQILLSTALNKKGLWDLFLGIASTLCLPFVCLKSLPFPSVHTTSDQSLDWRWQWPGNKANLAWWFVTEKNYRICFVCGIALCGLIDLTTSENAVLRKNFNCAQLASPRSITVSILQCKVCKNVILFHSYNIPFEQEMKQHQSGYSQQLYAMQHDHQPVSWSWHAVDCVLGALQWLCMNNKDRHRRVYILFGS